MIATILLVALAAATATLAAAMWAVSDEPYEKAAPWKRRDTKTLLSMDDVRAINHATRAFEELKASRR